MHDVCRRAEDASWLDFVLDIQIGDAALPTCFAHNAEDFGWGFILILTGFISFDSFSSVFLNDSLGLLETSN